MMGILFLILIITIAFYATKKGRTKSFPGYNGLPLVGVLPFLSVTNPHATYREWSFKLGTKFSLNFGSNDWIVLTDYEAIKEMFVKHAKTTSGRPYLPLYNDALLNGGMLFNNFKRSKKTVIRLYNSNIKNIEADIKYEAKELVMELGKKNEIAFDPKVVMVLLTGKRKSYNDENVNKIVRKIVAILNNAEDGDALLFLSMYYQLRHLPGFKGASKRLHENISSLLGDCKAMLDEREAMGAQNTTSMLDDLIVEMKNKENSVITKNESISIIFDMLLASTDTTAVTLQWCTLYLAHMPALRSELTTEVERNGEISYASKNRTPRLCSFIDEVIRHVTPVPVGIHKVTETFSMRDFTFEKDTTILPSYWCSNHDSKHFEDPDTFKPDRFIDRESGKFIKSKHVLGFGIGPRMCLGSKLADMELYIFLCSILKWFSIEEDASHLLPPLAGGTVGPVHNPATFKLKFVTRN